MATATPPTGTIALLFTDVDGSTRLAQALGAEWGDVLATHHALVGGAIKNHGGYVDGIEGDAFFATFDDPHDAAFAAVDALRALRAYPWPAAVGQLNVRMGLHVGDVTRTAIGYVGVEVNRTARVAAAANGDQLVLTGAATARTRQVLVTEPLGLHRLRDFPAPEQLFCAVVDGRGASSYPPLRTLSVRATNLPAGRPVVLGREHDLHRVRRAFLRDGERLVTLTGRGGTGKTALALEVGAQLLDEHAGGVWWVSLDAFPAGTEVMPAIAAAIRADGEAGQTAMAAVVEQLQERGPVLMILDNVEAVVDCADEIGELVEALPELRVLATSQIPLRLQAERLLRIDTLSDEASLELIRRVAERAGVAVGEEASTRAALRRVVHLLDGLPLALELAAGRLSTLTPTQLAARLGESPSLLADPRGDRPARQRSLQATVDWTLGLLDAAPRALFVRLGTFAGPVDLEDIEAVAGGDGLDVVDALSVLVDVALVRRVDDAYGRVRFGLPAALRQAAAAELDTSPDSRQWRLAHAQRQRDVAWGARLAWLSAGAEFVAAERSSREAAAALAWARSSDEPIAGSLAAAMGARLVDDGRIREALSMLEPLIAAPTGDEVVDGTALAAAGYALGVANRVDEAFDACNRALEVTADPGVRCFALGMRGFLHLLNDDQDAAVRESARATEIAADLGPAVLAGALLMEAQARLAAGDVEHAAEQLERGTLIGTPVDAKLLWSHAAMLADLAMQKGEPLDALPNYIESLIAAEARGNNLQVLFDLIGVAEALSLSGAAREACRAYGMAQAQARDMSGPTATVDHLLTADWMSYAWEALRPQEIRAEITAGREVPSARRVAVAYELTRAVTQELPV